MPAENVQPRNKMENLPLNAHTWSAEHHMPLLQFVFAPAPYRLRLGSKPPTIAAASSAKFIGETPDPLSSHKPPWPCHCSSARARRGGLASNGLVPLSASRDLPVLYVTHILLKMLFNDTEMSQQNYLKVVAKKCANSIAKASWVHQ